MKLFNTLGRKLETFRPFNPEEVKIYTCGPTVYSKPHIGNFAAYVYWDLLVRTLLMNGYGVKRVINFTDVGHLTSDADDGEDKMEKGARLSGETVWQVAEKYIREFKDGYEKLNLVEPQIWARATDYITEDEELVNTLINKGYTYETKDGIYYDTSKFAAYADFAKLDLENLKAGARVEYSEEKKNVSDFAVWKFIQPGENHTMRWDFLGRPGYPGWHLECSTIIHKELGETIDIHAGGIDHIPVHHTNEIAQSEAAFDKKLSKYWIHCHHLTVDKQKISKSLGNIWTLEDLAAKDYSPMDFKMWVLQGHYQSERDFNFENLEAARIRRLNWRNKIAECYQSGNKDSNGETWQRVLAAVSDNLNSPQAFALIDQVENGDLEFWRKIDQLFGIGLINDSPEISNAAKKLIDERQDARLARDYELADTLRDQLLEYNIIVKDLVDGQIWQYAR